MKKTLCACMLVLCMLLPAAGCGKGTDTSSVPTAADAAKNTDVRDAEYWQDYYREAPRVEQLTAFRTEVDGIPYGLAPEELLEALKEKGIELEPADYSNPMMLPEGIEIVKDGRQYNTANYRFAYATTNGLSFQYREDGVLDGVYVDNPDIPTAEGVKIGDDMEKMKAVYGTHCENQYGVNRHYRYYNGEQTLEFSFDDNGKIYRWCMETIDGE